MKIVLRVFVLVLSALCAHGHSQVVNYNLPDCIRPFSFTVPSGGATSGRSMPFDNRYGGDIGRSSCAIWHIVYQTNGQFSALSIEPDFANDAGGIAGSWSIWTASLVSSPGVSLPLTATSGMTGNLVSLVGAPAWVSVNLNSSTLSGTTTGIITGVLLGWRPQGSSDTTTGATQIQGTVSILPTSLSSNGITTVVSPSVGSSLVLKASAGNLYGWCVTTGATAGFLMVFNLTSAPVDGAVTPAEAPIQIAANQSVCKSYGSGPPSVFSTGITLVFSSTGPFTKTASSTATFDGRVK